MGLDWQGHNCVKNLPQVSVEVCAKFVGDWFGGSCMKEGHRYSLFYIFILANRAPVLPGKNSMRLSHPFGHF